MSLADLARELGISDGDQTWKKRGACVDFPSVWWFPEKGHGHNQQPARQAKEICRGCDVRVECLEYAITHNEVYGLWGGLGYKDRVKIKKLKAGAA